MLRLEWTTPAADQFEIKQRYYQALNPKVAMLLAMRVIEATDRLREHPGIGRPGQVEGTREWVVQNTALSRAGRSNIRKHDRLISARTA